LIYTIDQIRKKKKKKKEIYLDLKANDFFLSRSFCLFVDWPNSLFIFFSFSLATTCVSVSFFFSSSSSPLFFLNHFFLCSPCTEINRTYIVQVSNICIYSSPSSSPHSRTYCITLTDCRNINHLKSDLLWPRLYLICIWFRK